jgi:hypothetical protein
MRIFVDASLLIYLNVPMPEEQTQLSIPSERSSKRA